LRGAEDRAHAGSFLTVVERVAHDWSVGEEQAGARGEDRLERRFEIEFVDAGLGLPAVSRTAVGFHYCPLCRGAVRDQRPLAAFDRAAVGSKLFDPRRGVCELIAMLRRIFLGQADVISKRGLLLRVGCQLFLGGGRQGLRLRTEKRATGSRDQQKSCEWQKSGAIRPALRSERDALRKSGSHRGKVLLDQAQGSQSQGPLMLEIDPMRAPTANSIDSLRRRT